MSKYYKKIQLIKIPHKVKLVVLGVLFLFMFSGALFARGSNPSVSAISSGVMQQSQKIVVTGKITSAEDKTSIPGVNISVKGNSKMTVTSDIDGSYKITVPSSDAILVYSSVGYVTVERAVSAGSVINVAMRQDQTNLGEVIVVG